MKAKFYTVDEIGAALYLSPGAVRKMIQRGRLKAHRVGRRLLISEVQLDEYLVDVTVDNSED